MEKFFWEAHQMEENIGQRDWWALFENLLEPGKMPLAPLQVVRSTLGVKQGKGILVDFVIELSLPTSADERFRFAVEMGTRSTLKELERKADQVRCYMDNGDLPLVAVPYLSSQMLQYVEENELSALDLCGNGIVQVPGRLFVKRSGEPNKFPDTRPLQNAYGGRSAMVARLFLVRPEFESVTALWAAVTEAGEALGLPQVSKALSRLQDDLIVEKTPKGLRLLDPLRLLDKLARSWKEPLMTRRFVVMERSGPLASFLGEEADLHWALAGTSSVSRYTAFSQGAAPRVVVSNIGVAQKALGAVPEPVPNFADFELCEAREPGYFFAPQVDADGMRWASPVQTWLELQAGDARQQEAARDVRRQILEKLGR